MDVEFNNAEVAPGSLLFPSQSSIIVTIVTDNRQEPSTAVHWRSQTTDKKIHILKWGTIALRLDYDFGSFFSSFTAEDDDNLDTVIEKSDAYAPGSLPSSVPEYAEEETQERLVRWLRSDRQGLHLRIRETEE